MPRVVLDTNILVSALWTPAGNASTIISLVLSDKLVPCFDQRIINEYRAVLSRPRLAFPDNQVEELLVEICGKGLFVVVSPSSVALSDESDRKFFDVAQYCNAYLITGDIKHYPEDPLIINPANFLEVIRNRPM